LDWSLCCSFWFHCASGKILARISRAAEFVEEKISGNKDVLEENALIPESLRIVQRNVDVTHARTLSVLMDAMDLIYGE